MPLMARRFRNRHLGSDEDYGLMVGERKTGISPIPFV